MTALLEKMPHHPPQTNAMSCGATDTERVVHNPRAWMRWVLCAVLTTANLIPIWATTYFPSQNGPWFLLPPHMFLNYGNAQFDFSAHYIRNLHPIPHLLHDALVMLASLLMPLLTAEKLSLSIFAVLLPWSVFRFLRVVAPENRHLGYFSFLMIQSYPFLRGYHNFTLSIPLFFLALTAWIQIRDRESWRKMLVPAGISSLVFLSHLLPFVLLTGVIGWWRLFETRSWKRAFRSAFWATWPGWLLTVDYILFNRNSTWIASQDTAWTPFLRNLDFFFSRYFHSVSFPAYVLALFTWAWGAALVGVAICRRLPVSDGAIQRLLRHPLATVVVFLVLAYLVVPYKLVGWHKANVRLVPFVLILMLGAVGQLIPELAARGRRLAIIIPIIIATFGTNILVALELQKMDSLLQVYTSGVEKVGPRPRLLVIHLENPEFGEIRPMTWAHDYYHLAKGGANGKGLAGLNTLALMSYREYPVHTRFPEYRLLMSDEEASDVFSHYDHVLIWGESSRIPRQLGQAAFDLVHQKEKLSIYRKRPFGN